MVTYIPTLYVIMIIMIFLDLLSKATIYLRIITMINFVMHDYILTKVDYYHDYYN